MPRPVASQVSPENESEDVGLVEELVESFHKDLVATWRKKIAGKAVPEQIAMLREGLKGRQEALKPKEYASENLRTIREVPRELRSRMRDIDAHSEEVDRGENGRIIRCLAQDPTRPNVVYKVLLRPPLPSQNSLRSEAAYQADLHSFSLGHPKLRVRVPKPYFFVSKNGIDAMAQEEVTSCISVKNILHQDIPIPLELDIDRIFDAAQKFVDEMHKEGFYHRDLREGNIMINLDPTATETDPLAYVIDMGHCTQAWSEEEAYRKLDAPRDNVILNKVKNMLLKRREIQREREQL